MTSYAPKTLLTLVFAGLFALAGCSTVSSQLDDRLGDDDQDAAAVGYHQQEGQPAPGYEDQDGGDKPNVRDQSEDQDATASGYHQQEGQPAAGYGEDDEPASTPEPGQESSQEASAPSSPTAEPSETSQSSADNHNDDKADDAAEADDPVFSGPSPRERAMAAEEQARSTRGCELEEGEDPFQFMPFGTYEGQTDRGAGTMTMNDDHTLRITWTDHLTGVDRNIHADFKWEQQGIAESLRLCDIQGAAEGQSVQNLGHSTQAVLGFDKANHSFRVNIPEIGEVQFTKTQ